LLIIGMLNTINLIKIFFGTKVAYVFVVKN